MRVIIIAGFALLIASPVQAQWNPQPWTSGPLAPMNGTMPSVPPYVPPQQPTTWTGQSSLGVDYWHSNNGQSFSCQTVFGVTYCH
jgi:hypothetical protein